MSAPPTTTVFWNEAGAVFPFRLRPHYYQTVWFYALIVLMLGLAAYAFHRYRLGRVLELEPVGARIATDLHDDIGASLSQIAILSEVVGHQIENADPAVGKPLSRIAASSRELVDSMSDIVWAVNPKRDRLRDVIQRMRRFASDTLSSKEIAFTFEAPDSSSGLRLRCGSPKRNLSRLQGEPEQRGAAFPVRARRYRARAGA